MDDKGKKFIENTSHMSVNEIKKKIEKSQADFLKGLNYVKEKRLEELQSDLTFDSMFLFVSTIIIIGIVTMFIYMKV